MVKLFRLSIKLSQIENKLQTFAQTYAIDKFQREREVEYADSSRHKSDIDTEERWSSPALERSNNL